MFFSYKALILSTSHCNVTTDSNVLQHQGIGIKSQKIGTFFPPSAVQDLLEYLSTTVLISTGTLYKTRHNRSKLVFLF